MAQIAIDVDDTLYNFEDAARNEFLKLAQEREDKSLMAGAYAPWTQWRSAEDICGRDALDEVIKRCHDRKIIARQIPFEGAIETVTDLYNAGHELLYISNRATESHQATKHWLLSCGFPFDPDNEEQAATLVCTMESKKPYLTNCQYLIDDRPKTCVEFVYDHSWHKRWEHDILAGLHQRKAFMMMKQNNENLTDIPDLYLSPTWLGLRYYLEKKGVL